MLGCKVMFQLMTSQEFKWSRKLINQKGWHWQKFILEICKFTLTKDGSRESPHWQMYQFWHNPPFKRWQQWNLGCGTVCRMVAWTPEIKFSQQKILFTINCDWKDKKELANGTNFLNARNRRKQYKSFKPISLARPIFNMKLPFKKV